VHYAALLNVKEASFHGLNSNELPLPDLQSGIVGKIFGGSGDNPEKALRDAVDNLLNSKVFEVYECDEAANNIIYQNTGTNILRLLRTDGKQLKAIPFAHVDEFCKKHSLSLNIVNELLSLLAEEAEAKEAANG